MYAIRSYYALGGLLDIKLATFLIALACAVGASLLTSDRSEPAPV